MADYIVEEPSSQSASWRVHERIVRCRDCKHAFDEGSGYLYCGRRPGNCFEARADGFCAWGERKEVDA